MVTFVRSNNPNLEPRALRSIALLHPRDRVIIWNRNSTEQTDKSWVTLQEPAGYGVAMFKKLPKWWRFVYQQLRIQKPDVIHTCNFDSVVPCLLYSVLHRKFLIYDIWDCASGMLPINRPVISILNFIERVACTLSGAVLIPDPERLEQLGVSPNSSIRKKTLVIRNSQPYSHWKKRNLIIGNGKPISLVYSGTLTASIRGLEHIVHVLSKLHGAVTCTVIGYGGDEKKLVPLLSSCQHITFLGKMDPKNVRAITEKHDIVISLLDPSYTNYKYASSTKALEAISLGIPVITTEETATGNLIRQYDWGWVIPYSEDALYSLLLQLTNSGQTIRLNPETAESLDWKHSAAQLQSLYSPKKAIQAETV